jgi:hypothetical protein
VSSSAHLLVGEVARITVSIVDYNDLAADPGSLRLKVKAPPGTVTTYTLGAGVIQDAAGQYHADVAMTASGAWIYRWEADSPNAGAVEGQITVRKSALD